MKKFLLILFLILIFYSPSKHRFLIKDKRGYIYLCDFYKISKDGCVIFNDKPGYGGTEGFPTKLCKPYTIKKLKHI